MIYSKAKQKILGSPLVKALHSKIVTVEPLVNKNGLGTILARAASGTFALKLFGQLLMFVTQIVLARAMGVNGYGVYIYVLIWINILAMVTRFGLDSTLLRYVAAYRGQGEIGLLAGVIHSSHQFILLTNAIVIGLGYLIIWLMRSQLSVELLYTFFVGLLVLPLLAWNGLQKMTLQALRHVVLAQVPEEIIRPIFLAVVILTLSLGLNRIISSYTAMAIYLVVIAFSLFINRHWLNKFLPVEINRKKAVYRRQEWLGTAFPLLLMSGTYVILNQTDTIMIGVFLDTTQAGIYSTVSRISTIIGLGLLAVNTIAAPLISEYYALNRKKDLQRLVFLAAWGVFAFTIPVSLCLIIFGNLLLGLFGAKFTVGYIALIILIVGQIGNALAGSVGYLMTMTGHHQTAVIVLGGAALVNILLNLLLIPSFGIEGAATATATTTMLWNGLMLILVHQRIGVNPTIFPTRGRLRG